MSIHSVGVHSCVHECIKVIRQNKSTVLPDFRYFRKLNLYVPMKFFVLLLFIRSTMLGDGKKLVGGPFPLKSEPGALN